MKEDRYYYQEMEEVNTLDALKWLGKSEMVAIVDEKKGGIIGYAHQTHAEKLIKKLNK